MVINLATPQPSPVPLFLAHLSPHPPALLPKGLSPHTPSFLVRTSTYEHVRTSTCLVAHFNTIVMGGGRHCSDVPVRLNDPLEGPLRAPVRPVRGADGRNEVLAEAANGECVGEESPTVCIFTDARAYNQMRLAE